MTALAIAHIRFKQDYRTYFLLSLCTAFVIHAILLLTLPGIEVQTFTQQVIPRYIPVPDDDIIIPPKPEEVLKPAPIVEVSQLEADDDVIPGSTVIQPDFPVDTKRLEEQWMRPTYIPRDVEPRMLQHAVVYPELQKRIGIEGTVILWLLINELGEVEKVQLHTSSGDRALDDAAVNGYRQAVFSPALQGDIPVKVWVRLPVSFRIR